MIFPAVRCIFMTPHDSVTYWAFVWVWVTFTAVYPLIFQRSLSVFLLHWHHLRKRTNAPTYPVIVHYPCITLCHCAVSDCADTAYTNDKSNHWINLDICQPAICCLIRPHLKADIESPTTFQSSHEWTIKTQRFSNDESWLKHRFERCVL